VTPVKIREEKFIASNDVVSTTITADRPVTLEFTGRSYAVLKNQPQAGSSSLMESVHSTKAAT